MDNLTFEDDLRQENLHMDILSSFEEEAKASAIVEEESLTFEEDLHQENQQMKIPSNEVEVEVSSL